MRLEQSTHNARAMIDEQDTASAPSMLLSLAWLFAVTAATLDCSGLLHHFHRYCFSVLLALLIAEAVQLNATPSIDAVQRDQPVCSSASLLVELVVVVDLCIRICQPLVRCPLLVFLPFF